MNFRANSIRPYVSKSLEKPVEPKDRPTRRARGAGRKLSRLMNNGSFASGRNPLTVEQQELAVRYIPMAKSLAKPLKLSWPTEREEFESAAFMALVEAAQSFDPCREVKFATFARYRIWGALRDVQRNLVTAGWRGDMGHAPGVSSLSAGAEERGTVIGAEPDAPTGSGLEGLEYVESIFKLIPPRHAEACREIYLEGHSHSVAAKNLGCSKSRLSYLHKEALELITDVVKYQNRHDAVLPELEPLLTF